jgi:hypothetical protein
MKPPIKAIYREREDGDYDFVAAFAAIDEDESCADTYAENLRSEGESVIIKDFHDLSMLVDVLQTSKPDK